MIEFVIKSTISLIIFYAFYHLFLRDIKAFNFNRYFLLFSLLFAVTIPLITIRVRLNLPVTSPIHEFSHITANLIKGEETSVVPLRNLIIQNVLTIIYLTVSFILLLRFIFNIYTIIGQIRTSSIVNNHPTQIVLLEKEVLPYSFFKYIFVNRSDYENGKIEKEIIIHEQVHCLQYHSVDILIIEMVKIILWFNPLTWLYRNSIQLNHEFIADNKVLSTTNLYDYQNALINLVFRNNSTYLASNFIYSFTKKRLMMMNKKTIQDWIILRKIAIIPLFFILLITLAFTQVKEQKASNNDKTLADEQKAALNEQRDSFQIALANERKAAAEEQTASFQEGLANERKAAAEEQTASFQEGLANERKAAAEEQTASFQEGLANERKAAIKGEIVLGKKE